MDAMSSIIDSHSGHDGAGPPPEKNRRLENGSSRVADPAMHSL